MTARLQPKEVDTDLTPMIDVAFLMIIFFMCLPFRTLAAKLEAFLPEERGIHITDQRPPEIFWIKLHLVGRDERQREWGPPDHRQTVTMPTRVTYRFEDGRQTEDIEEVGRYIAQIKRAAASLERAIVRGEIKARPKVPHKYIVAVMNQFADRGVPDVNFYGTSLPDRRLLDAPVLPIPAGR